MSVQENIEFGLLVRKIEPNELKRRVDDIIEKLELGDIRNVREGSLSGGQRQRLALARGLVTEPEILLLDEPLGALDANLRKIIQEELKALQRSLNMTFIFVTHDQSEALALSDRIIVMNDGRVEQISTPSELYTRPKSLFVAKFIGKNILIDGQFINVQNKLAKISTPDGMMMGFANFESTGLIKGTKVTAVIPSELIRLSNVGTEMADGEQGLSCKVLDYNWIGRLIFLKVTLDDGSILSIETYIEDDSNLNLSVGLPIDLRWDADIATIVLNND